MRGGVVSGDFLREIITETDTHIVTRWEYTTGAMTHYKPKNPAPPIELPLTTIEQTGARDAAYIEAKAATDRAAEDHMTEWDRVWGVQR